jgi:hypothetical protein
MEACEVVRLFVNKAIVSAQPKRRENPGYGCLRALRVLVYARLKELENDTRVIEHLKKHPDAAKTFGCAKYLIEQLLGDGGDATLTFSKRPLRRYLICFSSYCRNAIEAIVDGEESLKSVSK